MTFILGMAAALLLAACATTEEQASEAQFREEMVAEILSKPLAAEDNRETERCIRDRDYRSFTALDDQRILFEGRRGEYWLNTLRHRCADLRFGHVLVTRRFSGTQMCSLDSFAVADWFDWPWYRRWPWHWGAWHSGMTCTLGEFQPVSEEQVVELRTLFDR